jgi:hypothetical protein
MIGSSLFSDYTFNNTTRMGDDVVDNTQKTQINTRFANYELANYYSDVLSDSHVKFATSQPTINFSGYSLGAGIGGKVVDENSYLLLKTTQERPLEKIQLTQRPFLTVPYLGKGSCDPTLESQLLQGELYTDKKSINTIMEKSFLTHSMYPTDKEMLEKVNNTSYTVEESALDGWVRGGASSREMVTDK